MDRIRYSVYLLDIVNICGAAEAGTWRIIIHSWNKNLVYTSFICNIYLYTSVAYTYFGVINKMFVFYRTRTMRSWSFNTLQVMISRARRINTSGPCFSRIAHVRSIEALYFVSSWYFNCGYNKSTYLWFYLNSFYVSFAVYNLKNDL